MKTAWFTMNFGSSKARVQQVEIISEDQTNPRFTAVTYLTEKGKKEFGIFPAPKACLFDTLEEATAYLENRLFDEKVERTRVLANYLKRYNGAMKAEMKITVVE